MHQINKVNIAVSVMLLSSIGFSTNVVAGSSINGNGLECSCTMQKPDSSLLLFAYKACKSAPTTIWFSKYKNYPPIKGFDFYPTNAEIKDVALAWRTDRSNENFITEQFYSEGEGAAYKTNPDYVWWDKFVLNRKTLEVGLYAGYVFTGKEKITYIQRCKILNTYDDLVSAQALERERGLIEYKAKISKNKL